MSLIRFASIFLFSVSLVHGQDSDSSSSEVRYLFMSGKLSAQVRDKVYPVASFDGKNLQLDGLKKTVKPNDDLTCLMQPVMVVSSLYADIGELDYIFVSNAERLAAMQTLNRMESDQMRFEAGVDFENSVLYTANRRPGVTAADQRAMDLEALSQDQKDDLIRRTGMNKVVDNVHGSCVISASQSMENVYTALVLTLEVLNSGKSPDVIKGSIVRILPVGDLEVGEEENFKFNLDFPAVRVANANLDFYFFYGEGKHIATNLSQRLKKLSSEQLEQLRAMQRKGVE